MTGTLANGYSFESIHRELYNEYQHDRVKMIFKSLYVDVLWTKVASALEGLKHEWVKLILPMIVGTDYNFTMVMTIYRQRLQF